MSVDLNSKVVLTPGWRSFCLSSTRVQSQGPCCFLTQHKDFLPHAVSTQMSSCPLVVPSALSGPASSRPQESAEKDPDCSRKDVSKPPPWSISSQRSDQQKDLAAAWSLLNVASAGFGWEGPLIHWCGGGDRRASGHGSCSISTSCGFQEAGLLIHREIIQCPLFSTQIAAGFFPTSFGKDNLMLYGQTCLASGPEQSTPKTSKLIFKPQSRTYSFF